MFSLTFLGMNKELIGCWHRMRIYIRRKRIIWHCCSRAERGIDINKAWSIYSSLLFIHNPASTVYCVWYIWCPIL